MQFDKDFEHKYIQKKAVQSERFLCNLSNGRWEQGKRSYGLVFLLFHLLWKLKVWKP